MNLNKENTKKILKIITFTLVLFFLLQNVPIIIDMIFKILGVLSPFLFGIGIAFIVNIPMSSIEKLLHKSKKGKNKKIGIKRLVSILLSLIFILVIIGLIIKLIIPQLISIIVMFASYIPEWSNEFKESAINLTKQYPDISQMISSININWEQIINELMNIVKNFTGSLVTSSISFATSLIGGIVDAIISIVFAVYILMSKEKLAGQFTKLIKAYLPESTANYILEVCKLSEKTFSNFISGQCLEAVVLGLLCFLGMTILRLPYSATVSVFVGVTALIPIVGCILGLIIGAILILSISPIKALIFVCFLLILQQIESNIIYPRVVGTSIGLPGMWVLVAVVLGGHFGGMIGLLLGLPIAAVLYSILRSDVYNRLKSKNF